MAEISLAHSSDAAAMHPAWLYIYADFLSTTQSSQHLRVCGSSEICDKWVSTKVSISTDGTGAHELTTEYEPPCGLKTAAHLNLVIRSPLVL